MQGVGEGRKVLPRVRKCTYRRFTLAPSLLQAAAMQDAAYNGTGAHGTATDKHEGSPVLALGIKALRSAPRPRRLLPGLEWGIFGEHHARHATAILSDGARVAIADECAGLVEPAGKKVVHARERGVRMLCACAAPLC